jgi:hypothetical protein
VPSGIAPSSVRARAGAEAAARAGARVAWPLLGALTGLLLPAAAHAQPRLDVPVSPTPVIGAVANSAALAVLGVAARPVDDAAGVDARGGVWLGATQPLAHVGDVRLALLGGGEWQPRNRAGGSSGGEGTVSLRALARIGAARTWTAATYGRAILDGEPIGALVGYAGYAPAMSGMAFDATPTDTTISRRVDVGQMARVESGLFASAGPLEFTMGIAVERVARVTTQTLTIDVADAVMPAALQPLAERAATVRTLRAVQRRDVASGMATMGFATGPTSWLLAVTSPLATWISGDERLPRPPVQPAVVSLTVAQPLTGWFSLVGSASSGPTGVGSTVLRDDLAATRRGPAPVFAVGLRIARAPFGGRGGVPIGILGFETRVGDGDRSPAAMPTILGDSALVELLVDAPRAGTVELMGDATEWSIVHMSRLRDGRWRAQLRLAPGVHRVVVRADGGPWMAPPGLPVGNDDFGTAVGLLVVRGR